MMAMAQEGTPATTSAAAAVAEEGEQRYLRLCRDYGVLPDASFLTAVRTRATGVRFSRRISDLDLLAISDYLCPPDATAGAPSAAGHFPPRWDFSRTAVGSNGAALVARMLSHGLPFESVQLNSCGVGPRGFRRVAEALESGGVSPALRSLGMAGNLCQRDAARAFAHALEHGAHSLETVDLSNDHLTYAGEVAVEQAIAAVNARRASSAAGEKKQQQKPHLVGVLHGNIVKEELWNSITHGLGFVGALLATGFIACRHKDSGPERAIPATIFCASLIAVYLSSALYHSFFLLPRVKAVLRRFDHCSIFLLIAGSYAPFALITFHGRIGNALFVFVWAFAAVGIAITLLAFGKYPRFSLFLYLAMGWGSVLVAAPVFTHPGLPLSRAGFLWLFAGGVFYSVGTIFFSSEKPSMHVVWHFFVLLGSLCHVVCIDNYVLDAPFPDPPVDKFFFSK